MVDVFDKPGTADLTANVDFAYLKESIDGLGECDGPHMYDARSGVLIHF